MKLILFSIPKPLLLLFLASSLLRTSRTQTTTTTTTNTTDCYSNTTLLLQALEAADTATTGSQTFRLCANTVFPITDFALADNDNQQQQQQQQSIIATTTTTTYDDNVQQPSKTKMAPLFLKSNVTIQCGDNGASTNNCTLLGGPTQVVSLPTIFTTTTTTTAAANHTNGHTTTTTTTTTATMIENAAVYGVTFVSATETAALLANAGNVTFVDCVFRDHINVGAVTMAWSPTLGLPPSPETEENDTDDTDDGGVNEADQQPGSNWDHVSQVVDNVNQFADQFRSKNSNRNRDLSHITLQIKLPEECTMVDFEHDFASVPARLVDLVQCTDFCGPGKYINITVTSVCTTLDEEGCVNTMDCVVAGCNEDCNAEAGECDCTDKFGQAADGSLTVTGFCEEVCGAEPVDAVTLAPTLPPTFVPTSAPVTVAVPATNSPTTPAPVTAAVPVTTSPTTSAPVTAAVPVTISPTTAVPVTGAVPTDSPTPPSASSNRQKVTFRQCSFLSNKPLPTETGPKAIVVVDTAFSDLVIEDCYFANNDYSQVNNDTAASTLVEDFNSYGVAVLVEAGSTLQMSGTCFLFNNFSGPGSVVVAGDPDPLLYESAMLNNFGTADDGLTCPFLALVSSLGQSPSTCVDYDAAECGIRPPGATPPVTESTPSPVVAGTDEPTSSPVVAGTDEPTSSPVVAGTNEPTTSPVETPEDSPASSAPPTAPPEPSGEEEEPVVCHVCPDGEEITLPQALIVIPAGFVSDSETYITCELLERSITMNPEQVGDFCPVIQQNYAEPCGCSPIGGDGDDDDEQDATPPVTESTPVSEPSGEEEELFVCHICPDGEAITLPQAMIVVPAGFISDSDTYVTCDLMERAIAMNPEQLAGFCDLIQQNYAEPCGCLPIEDDNNDDEEDSEIDIDEVDSSSDLRRWRRPLSLVVASVVLFLC